MNDLGITWHDYRYYYPPHFDTSLIDHDFASRPQDCEKPKSVCAKYEAAKKLFTEARSGKLKCTKEELDAHVRQTYSDPKRDERLSDMRGLKRPTAPCVSYLLGSIREKEVDEFVRKASAESAPGGDGVSYKVFKYCDKLRHTLFEMLRDLWKDKEIVKDWCRVEGMYLSKEQNAENIGQFQPISIINVAWKIFMGILLKRTVTYLQSNGYVGESVQKAGVPGIPGCIEHAFTIWDAVQEAKKTNESLNMAWLDLANAYGSVPLCYILPGGKVGAENVRKAVRHAEPPGTGHLLRWVSKQSVCLAVITTDRLCLLHVAVV